MNNNIVLISGFNLNDNNRGTAALSYGAIYFLYDKGYLQNNDILVNFCFYKNIFKNKCHSKTQKEVRTLNHKWTYSIINVFFIEKILLLKFGISLPFTTFGKICRRMKLVAAINGGDGFSDIYGTQTFRGRLSDTFIAMRLGARVIQLPQTLGPFKYSANYNLAKRILSYASKVFVRDNKFTKELDKMGINYELTKDLSFYMPPERWNIDVKHNAIGINVSGLAYSNNFRSLKGQFQYYPFLISSIIQHFQKSGYPIYLIPHSYNYSSPEADNDDMVACKDTYNNLKDKSNVFLIDKNLTSPQVKYLISRMSFFIGTRMHANFAAIFTNVPVYGLSYSYKFEGAFKNNGIDGHISDIRNIRQDDVEDIVKDIDKVFRESMGRN